MYKVNGNLMSEYIGQGDEKEKLSVNGKDDLTEKVPVNGKPLLNGVNPEEQNFSKTALFG